MTLEEDYSDYSDAYDYTDNDDIYYDLDEDERAHYKKYMNKSNADILRNYIDDDTYYDKVYKINNRPVDVYEDVYEGVGDHRDHRDHRRSVRGGDHVGSSEKLIKIDTKLDVILQMLQVNKLMTNETTEKNETNDMKEKFEILKSYLKKNERNLNQQKKFFKQNGDTENYKEIKLVLKLIN
jgi:hypothetical protein